MHLKPHDFKHSLALFILVNDKRIIISDVDQDTYMFGSHETSLTYRVHTNQDKKGDKTKIRTQQYIQLNTRAKESKS